MNPTGSHIHVYIKTHFRKIWQSFETIGQSSLRLLFLKYFRIQFRRVPCVKTALRKKHKSCDVVQSKPANKLQHSSSTSSKTQTSNALLDQIKSISYRHHIFQNVADIKSHDFDLLFGIITEYDVYVCKDLHYLSVFKCRTVIAPSFLRINYTFTVLL